MPYARRSFLQQLQPFATDPILEQLGDRPENGGHEWPNQPHVAEQFGLGARFYAAFQVNRTAVLQAERGGLDLEVIADQDAIGHHERAIGRLGPTAAQPIRKGVEDGAENAKQRDVPNQPVMQLHLAIAVGGPPVLGVSSSHTDGAIQPALRGVGTRGERHHEGRKRHIGDSGGKLKIIAALGSEIEVRKSRGLPAVEIRVHIG